MESTIVGALLGFIAAVFPRLFIALSQHFAYKKDLETTAQTIDAATKGIVVVGRSFDAATAEATVVKTQDVPASSWPPVQVSDVLPEQIKVYSAKQVIDTEGHDPDDEWELEAGQVRPLAVRVFATLRAGVRPLITYGFFSVFAYVKLKGMLHGFYVDHTPAILLLPVLWDEGTQALFAAVLAFWFGSRSLEKQLEITENATARASAGNNP
jgi:hypothetical protein